MQTKGAAVWSGATGRVRLNFKRLGGQKHAEHVRAIPVLAGPRRCAPGRNALLCASPPWPSSLARWPLGAEIVSPIAAGVATTPVTWNTALTCGTYDYAVVLPAPCRSLPSSTVAAAVVGRAATGGTMAGNGGPAGSTTVTYPSRPAPTWACTSGAAAGPDFGSHRRRARVRVATRPEVQGARQGSSTDPGAGGGAGGGATGSASAPPRGAPPRFPLPRPAGPGVAPPVTMVPAGITPRLGQAGPAVARARPAVPGARRPPWGRRRCRSADWGGSGVGGAGAAPATPKSRRAPAVGVAGGTGGAGGINSTGGGTAGTGRESTTPGWRWPRSQRWWTANNGVGTGGTGGPPPPPATT